MKFRHWTLIVVLALCATAGCHSSDSTAAPATADTMPAADAPPSRPIPPGSIFAKIKVGMGHDQVVATIGQPTTESAYQTGKAFIPFHFGGDNYRTAAHYKGVGLIVFTSDSSFTSSRSVMEIDFNPDDPGY